MTRATSIADVECFKDWFAVGVLDLDAGKHRFFEQTPTEPFPVREFRAAVKGRRLVTFNGTNYDLPLIALALAGKACPEIKRASDAIIKTGLRPWTIAEQFGGAKFEPDHVDLIEVAPGKSSLKIYAGRLHVHSLHDLPVEPDASITPELREALREYCITDLDNTRALLEALGPQIALREQMSEQYGQDLRSRGDAQIAEHVIRAEVEKILGHSVAKPKDWAGETFRYDPPRYIEFDTPELQALLERIRVAEFVVRDTGKVVMPKMLEEPITIGCGIYRMGIGGLHSSEQSRAIVPAEGESLIDLDVESYYPSLILSCGLYPEQMGPTFLKVYRGIVERRLDAKHSGDKVTNDTLKIVINGSFGKLGSKWSSLYAPDLMIQVTLTGQLALLMLIEYLETHGERVVSANTDGIVVLTRDLERLRGLAAGWMLLTGLNLEEAQYRALYSRDVNAYVAIKADGHAKLKGPYAPVSLSKNPQAEVCVRAAIEYLKHGTPVDRTIRTEDNIARFLILRKVQGGALDQMGLDCGKTVRWYYSADVEGPLTYKVNGNKVPNSEGAVPVAELPDSWPQDINYGRYIQMALEILEGLGAQRRQGELLNAA
jgi:hypothetical protein